MCENAKSSRNWTAGCGESYLSGAGSAGRKSTAERQYGRRPSTPFRGRHAPAFDLCPAQPRVLRSPLVRDEVVEMRQAREKRCLAPTGMVESLHGEELAVDGVMRLIQHRAHRRHLRVCEHGIPAC